jgi:membrane protease YdiL (CAAX protease family)
VPVSSIDTASQWRRRLAGLAAVFALFHWSALALGSDRGQAGLIVGLLVVTATLAVERAFFGQPFARAARAVGLGAPTIRGLATSAAVCAALLLIIPAFVIAAGESPAFLPAWLWLLPGLFAQGGIAEEVLFRGYLFGRLRRGRSFWRAAWLSMLPFVAVHLLLFFTMPWPIALAALLLAVVLSIPLAHLFELCGNTIWAPALLHFVIQGTVKVIVFPDSAATSFALAWMIASALLPLAVLLVPRRGAGIR